VEAGGADLLHVDVMDGHFVPNITIGIPVVEAIRKRTRLPLDLHLMIAQPDLFLERFVKAGGDSLTIHVEACPHLHRTLGRIHELGARAGVALNPATPPGVLDYALDSADLVLVMSVNPGFGGQTFIPTTYPKVKDVRERIGTREVEVEIDGA
jgi:ribulose-phosphate 3-epimerase